MKSKPYCYVCKRTFKTRLRLKKHLNHHKKIRLVNYLCRGHIRDYE